MNTTEHTAQTFTDILFADKRIWETVVTIDDNQPIDIRFAKELVDLNGKVVALAIVMSEKPHTWFFDCSQTFTADIAQEGCEMTFSYNPWDATEGKQVQGKVVIARRLRKQDCLVKQLMGGIPVGELAVYYADGTGSKNPIDDFSGRQPQAKTRPMKAAVNTPQTALLVPFKYAGLHEYKYDTSSRTVLSFKRSATPRPLTWVRKGNGLYVKLYDAISRTINLSRTDIETHWINTDIDFCNQIQLEAVDAPSTGMCDQTAIEESDYVLYSVQNKCCRYFESNTQLEEAIRQLRNDCATAVEPEDIRVLIPRTGESKRIVEVKTCTTYKLD